MHAHHHIPRIRSGPARRGSIYVIVMATTLVVLVLSMGAIATQRTLAAARAAAREEAQARRLAASAAELAIESAQNTLRWRSGSASPIFDSLELDGGFISAAAGDPVDSNISNNITDPILITATGRIGSARQKVSVRANVNPAYLSCLWGVMHAGGGITITSASIRSTSPITANGSVSASSSSVRCDVSAGGSITGSTYGGTNTGSQPARAMPSADVVTTYAAMATPISYNALNGGRIRRTILSGNSNPYGDVNTSGIYSINCGGASLEIQDCRITGTLVITNCPTLTITNSVHFSPWDPGLPVLITSGSIVLSTVATDVYETTAGNLNPSGDPYEGGTDSDQSDTYPSIITGLVYAAGNIQFTGRSTIVGAVVAGGNISLQSGSNVVLWRSLTNAPPGFVTRAFEIDSTTWKKVVD